MKVRLRFALAVLACLLLSGCTAGLGPEPSRGVALAERISTTGLGAAWYESLILTDGKPKVEVYSAGKDNGVDLPGGKANVFMVDSTPQTLATSACNAIAGVVNDPKYGTSLSISDIWVVFGSTRVECYPPQKP